MKRIIMFGFVIACLEGQSQINIGIKTGLNIANQSRKEAKGYVPYETSAKAGLHLGVIAEKQVFENVFVQPQLLYSFKGSTHKSTGSGIETIVKMNYVDLPLNVVYKYELPFGKVFAGAGPVFSYSFSGKLEKEGETKKMFSDDIKNWKHGDVAINILAGVEMTIDFLGSISYQ